MLTLAAYFQGGGNITISGTTRDISSGSSGALSGGANNNSGIEAGVNNASDATNITISGTTGTISGNNFGYGIRIFNGTLSITGTAKVGDESADSIVGGFGKVGIGNAGMITAYDDWVGAGSYTKP